MGRGGGETYFGPRFESPRDNEVSENFRFVSNFNSFVRR